MGNPSPEMAYSPDLSSCDRATASKPRVAPGEAGLQGAGARIGGGGGEHVGWLTGDPTASHRQPSALKVVVQLIPRVEHRPGLNEPS